MDAVTEMCDFADVLQESKQILEQCFTQYNTDEVFLSFNGGKDCTVLLDITLNFLAEHKKTRTDLKVVYIRTRSPFRELEEFVKEIEDHYKVELLVTEGEMKQTLQELLKNDERLQACLMGSRRTDPYCDNLGFMQKTDPDWPPIVRVSPLLNWSYHHIWSYILQKNVPYCSLYNIGYTSIGSTMNSSPNPSLAYENQAGCISYHPAWRLKEASQERAGRGNNPTKNNLIINNSSDTNLLNGNAS